jgi:hypothetical protein
MTSLAMIAGMIPIALALGEGVVCFAGETMRTRPRNHANQESRKDRKIQ